MVTSAELNDSLANRILALEERNAVQELTARYCFYANARQEKLSELREIFHTDATLTTPWGIYAGRQEIIEKFFFDHWKVASELHHLTHNHVITVKGEKAASICHFEATMTMDEKPYICSGTYDDELVKENGNWLFMNRIYTIHFLCPLSEGWAAQRQIHSAVAE